MNESIVEIQACNSAEDIATFVCVPENNSIMPGNESAIASELLSGTHPLSNYFDFKGFLAFKNSKAVGRIAATLYHGESTAYFGFFECIDEGEVARCLFDAVEKYAMEHSCSAVVGPVDASFWIRYRFKLNGFEKEPFIGEPINEPYYAKLASDAGYSLMHGYSSAFLDDPSAYARLLRSVKHMGSFARKHGYTIRTLSDINADRYLDAVYDLIMVLYSSFETFHRISEAEFKQLFGGMAAIADPDMVLLAENPSGKPVGFCICLPERLPKSTHCVSADGPAAHDKDGPPRRYTLLYLGTLEGNDAATGAMLEEIVNRLEDKGCTLIAALMSDKGTTQRFTDRLKTAENRYGLFRKNLGGS